MKTLQSTNYETVNPKGGTRGRLLFWYVLLIPVIVILRQYFKVSWAGEVSKVFAVLFVLACLSISLPRLIERSRTALFSFGFLVVYPILLGTCVGAFGTELNTAAVFSHSFGALLLWVCLSAGTRVDAAGFLRLARKFGWHNLIWNAGLLAFYRIDPLGYGGYEGFDSSGLIPSLAAAAITGASPLVWLHLVVMFLAGKRIIFFACLLAWGGFYFSRRLTAAWKLAFASAALAIGVGAAALAIPFATGLPDRFADVRAVAFIFSFLDADFSADASFEQRISEVVSSYEQVVGGIADLVFGNGVGWHYQLESWFALYDLEGERYYLHFTPAFIVLIWGFGGAVVYLAAWWVAFRSMLKGDAVGAFCGVYLLIQLLVGLTRLNLFTEPGIAFIFGAAMASLGSSSKRGGGYRLAAVVSPKVG